MLEEGKTIQDQLAKRKSLVDDNALIRRFTAMAFNNNLRGAMSLVLEKGKGGVLKVDNAIKKVMLAKHPVPEPVLREALLDGEQVDIHPVFFDALNGDLIRHSGSAGVSQQEDNLWHKMLTAHRETLPDLSHELAEVLSM